MSDADVMPDFLESAYANAVVEPNDEVTPDEKPTRTRRTRSDKGQPRGSRGTSSSTKDKKLAEDLLGPWALIIKALAMPMPTVAAVMSARGEKTTNAIVSLASPKLKEKLSKVSKLGPGSELLETGAMVVVAALLDLHKLDPDSPLVMFSGAREYFDMTHEVSHQEDVSVPQQQNGYSNVTNFPGMPSSFTPFPGA